MKLTLTPTGAVNCAIGRDFDKFVKLAKASSFFECACPRHRARRFTLPSLVPSYACTDIGPEEMLHQLEMLPLRVAEGTKVLVKVSLVILVSLLPHLSIYAAHIVMQ